MTILYKADDPISTRWTGLGRLKTAYEEDHNWYQVDTRIATLEGNYALTVSIDTITQPTPSQLLFTMTDASTQGPFDIPVSTFRDTGDWAIDTPYIVNDTFTAPDGGLYRVTYAHTSSHTSFDPNANDGMGHDYYASMISPRGNVFPAGGAVGMGLRKNSTNDYDFNAAFFRASEIVFAPSSDSALTSVWVADAIEEVETLIGAVAATIPTGFDATAITYTPASWLSATDVDAALAQLADINALHVGFAPTTDSALIATNVADALVELELLLSSGAFQPVDADLTALAANATDGLWAHTGAGTGAARTITQGTGISVTNGDGVAGNPTIAVTTDIKTGAIKVVIDGGGSAITTGVKGYLPVEIAGTITEAKMVADQSGSIVVDVWKCTYTNFDAGSTHPVSGDKITASAPPTITTATKSKDTTLTGWTTTFAADDVFAFSVTSATTITRVVLTLKFTKS